MYWIIFIKPIYKIDIQNNFVYYILNTINIINILYNSIIKIILKVCMNVY